jgi:Domain of unknown function (DUF4157)
VARASRPWALRNSLSGIVDVFSADGEVLKSDMTKGLHPNLARAATHSATPRAGVLQRKCACGGSANLATACEDCEQRLSLQRSTRDAATPTSDSVSVPPFVQEVLQSSGRPLDAATRSFFEPRFGHDFARVRVHTDGSAALAAAAVKANAFTVGQDVVFGAAQFAPASSAGRRLLAHELTHVVQQQAHTSLPGHLTIGPASDDFEREADDVASSVGRGENANVEKGVAARSANTIQRDLLTEPPAVPAPAQPDLTPDQIQRAIAFNRRRYDEPNTRIIQDILGGPVTGVWSDGNIEAIASTQEQYGFTKDGMVGPDMFRFLNEEMRLGGLPTTTENCLTSFAVFGPDTPTLVRVAPNACRLRAHFRTASQFSARCNCAQFQYRQFIRGHFNLERGGVVTDRGAEFNMLPNGRLDPGWQEDGDTTDNPVHYGHRNAAADAVPEDHYINDLGADDQLNGCRYRSEDTPGGILNDCRVGDIYDWDLNFRGEIQRNGAAIETKFWTAARNRLVAPP